MQISFSHIHPTARGLEYFTSSRRVCVYAFEYFVSEMTAQGFGNYLTGRRLNEEFDNTLWELV